MQGLNPQDRDSRCTEFDGRVQAQGIKICVAASLVREFKVRESRFEVHGVWWKDLSPRGRVFRCTEFGERVQTQRHEGGGTRSFIELSAHPLTPGCRLRSLRSLRPTLVRSCRLLKSRDANGLPLRRVRQPETLYAMPKSKAVFSVALVGLSLVRSCLG